MNTINIGQISYLNVWPFFYFLKKENHPYHINFIEDHPAKLNDLLLKQEIDLAPASSFEYLLHSEEYFLLPDLSISALEKVKSVLFCSPVPLDNLSEYLNKNQKTVLLTSASASSINLLKILWNFYWQLPEVDFRFKEPGKDWQGDCPFLEIGDLAFELYLHSPKNLFIYDLAQEWHSFTGLPFIFALWIVSKRALEKLETILDLKEKLISYKQKIKKDYLELSKKINSRFSTQEIANYWQTMDYDLTAEHKASILLYAHYLWKLNLIPGIPGLKFI